MGEGAGCAAWVQEIGWDFEMAINPRESLLSAPRNQTDLTKFADALWKAEGAVIAAAREAKGGK